MSDILAPPPVKHSFQSKFQLQIDDLNQGIMGEPFAFLGPHKQDLQYQLRVFIPGAQQVFYQSDKHSSQQYRYQYQQVGNSALFILNLAEAQYRADYQLQIVYPLATVIEYDPYKFTSTQDPTAVYLFNEGTLEQAQRHLGAHWLINEGVEGVRFTLWAPNAKAVSVIGDFNHWEPCRHPMRKHPESGIWEIFIPDIGDDGNNYYKFRIISATGECLEKADPFALVMQLPVQTASVVPSKMISERWQRSAAQLWGKRAARNAIDAPICIYEVHAGSWRRNVDDESGGYLSYRQLADQLVPYVKGLGFTHIQLMPISEFPFDGSRGYQRVGLFAPTSRFGGLDDFQFLVDACHAADIGLLVNWPGDTPFTDQGGGGFGYKWNMGWMNDSLAYMRCDPLYRRYHHNEMTFSLAYAFSENFILALSHGEVVPGKGSLLEKMPGDDGQKFANLRAYYGFMWAHPGKKLLFMGGEFAQRYEWDHEHSLNWHLLEQPAHRGVQRLIKQLNNAYCNQPALFELDFKPEGFRWIDVSNAERSVFSFIRYSKAQREHLVVIANMATNGWHDYRVGVPANVQYDVLMNTDDPKFGGSGFTSKTSYKAEPIPWQGFEQSICIALPPLATMYLIKEGQ